VAGHHMASEKAKQNESAAQNQHPQTAPQETH
jgi:hypothetical protein